MIRSSFSCKYLGEGTVGIEDVVPNMLHRRDGFFERMVLKEQRNVI